MDIFDILTLIGGLCLFLFGMNVMGDALERSAGSKLDERLLATPAIALERAHALAVEMADTAIGALSDAMECLTDFSAEKIDSIREKEKFTDECEDRINGYLIKLSANQIGDEHSTQAATILKIVGDLERIGDHAMNVAESAQEIRDKGTAFTEEFRDELDNIRNAMTRILALTQRAFTAYDLDAAGKVDALERIVDELKERYRSNHIRRLQKGKCTVEAGFIWSDILTNLERVADHCDNIANSVLDDERHVMNVHNSLRIDYGSRETYTKAYEEFRQEFLS